ncbi:MAG: ribonuclease III domain-containing protein [Benniella sp.]|nr:MAG: ribonuclease III domain-containing protein [Benniella sp.]
MLNKQVPTHLQSSTLRRTIGYPFSNMNLLTQAPHPEIPVCWRQQTTDSSTSETASWRQPSETQSADEDRIDQQLQGRRLTKRTVGLHVLSGQANRALQRLIAAHSLPGIASWRDFARLNEVEQAAAGPMTHRHLQPTIAQVEDVIGYRFNNKNLLAQALRPKNTQRRYWEVTNDRLEYLGDAVLETCAPLFWIKNNIDLNTLSQCTSASVCNLALQTVMLEFGLDAYLIGATDDQLKDIAQAREEHELARDNNPSGELWKGIHLFKTLADAMEAIFGTVFLDSDMKFSDACDLFERLKSREKAIK